MNKRPRYPFVWLGLPLALIILFTIGPLVLLLLGGAVAGALGCNMPIAATAPCLFMGADLNEAVEIALLASSVAVEKAGVAAVSADELLEAEFAAHREPAEAKIVTREGLLRQVARWRAAPGARNLARVRIHRHPE